MIPEKNKLKSLRGKVDLAILAHGGKDWRKEWCQCDPSVGMVPCEYCAIYTALREMDIYIKKEIS